MNNAIEKAASPDRDQIIRNAVVAAIAAAGIGAVARDMHSKKKRREINDATQSKNAIVVDVKKSKFMEGLPTPDELAESRGESAAQAKAPAQIEAPAEKPVANPAENAVPGGDIAAMKREILKNKGRKVDFFRKAAETASVKVEEKKPVQEDEKGEEKKEEKKEEKSESGRLLFRGSDGKFVSPTDPLAIADVEKDAEYDWMKGVVNTVAHPIDTLGVMWNAAKDKPVEYTVGAVGTIWLATLISDAINKARREKSKKTLDDARDEYVSILEGGGNEKMAEDDPRAAAGAILGAAFIAPAAIGAIITNKIIENRRAAKKKEEDMSDSYPDDPIIMYKTSEDKEMQITPETALFGFLVKRAMILSAEADEANMVKAAQANGGDSKGFWGQVGDVAKRSVLPPAAQLAMDGWNGLKKAKPLLRKGVAAAGALMDGPIGVDEAYDKFMPLLENPDNNEHLLNYVKSVVDPNAYALKPGQKEEMFEKMTQGMDEKEKMRLGMTLKDPVLGPQLMSKIKTGERMQKLIMDRATSDNYADSWGKFKEDRVNHYLNTELGLKNGGWLQRLFAWIINHTGLANYFARNKITSQFNDWRAAANKQMAGGNTQQGKTQSPAATGSAGTPPQGGASSAAGASGAQTTAVAPKNAWMSWDEFKNNGYRI